MQLNVACIHPGWVTACLNDPVSDIPFIPSILEPDVIDGAEIITRNTFLNCLIAGADMRPIKPRG